MDEPMAEMLKYLRLRGLLAHWDRYIKIAGEQNFTPEQLLKYVVEQEHGIKQENSRLGRLTRAKIPQEFVMETFPFNRQPNLKKKKILTFYDSFDYMKRKQNGIWIGPTGTGKTGLATAFLIHAINQGYSGRFILFPELIEMLYQSVGDHSESTVIRKFASYECLLIDELGYVEIEPVQVGLFFTLMHKRHQHKTTLITSNLGFQQWDSFLKNSHLVSALVDRLTENSHVINMKNCVSLRNKLDSE
ncbi:MAG: hypothetical protein FVQ79_11490 [Planctomycetes bacterium]|nr:hypothetical protein [Planctomycetota bacterium]